jgi:tetratricopeptide (TPR) repeat protein
MLKKLSVDQALIKAKSHLKKNEVIEAKKLYQVILQAFPQNLRAQEGLTSLNKLKQFNDIQNPPQETVNRLVNLYKQGQFLSVIKQAQSITNQYPEAFMVWNILGASAAEIGMLDQAVEAYNKALLLKPDYAKAYNNMGITLREQGKLDKAIEAYKKAVSLNPDYAEAYCNMSVILKDQGKLDQAVEFCKKALSIKPDYAQAYSNMGIALREQDKLEEAITAYKKAVSLKPDYAEAISNMGNIFKDQGKLEEAIEAYNKCISLKPDYAKAYSGLGIALKEQGKLDESITEHKKALILKPDYAQAHLNLSYALLTSDRLKEGLEEYEWRWKTPKFLSWKRHFLQPLWNGQTSLKGKKILLWCEQGIGDTINWSSYLPLIASQAEHCIVECQDKLIPLLERSFPNVEIKAENRNFDSQRNDFDVHLPMGSLYKHFFEEITQTPKTEAFLIPDPARVNFWKDRLKSLGKGPYIGISWKSSVVSAYRLQHYPPISEWSPILTIPDVTFINLQYVDFEEDVKAVKDELGVTVHNFDDLDQYNNIDDVAALCAALDIVVSTKVTPPFISSAVGTSTKIANWKQSTYNSILTNFVTLSFEMYEKNTWESWDNVFCLIAENILELKNKTTYSKNKL